MSQVVSGLWDNWDELLEGLKTPADWSQKHGDDWTFADVPYHMTYVDRDLVTTALEQGENASTDGQKVMRTLRELNVYNELKFAERPNGQTGDQSVDQWRAVRGGLQNVMSQMSDEDLGKPTWFPLLGGGWVPGMMPAGFCLGHAWSEFVQLRYLMGANAPEPSPEAVHMSIGFFQNLFGLFMDRGRAKGAQFTAVMEYTGPGGGEWTIRVEDGEFSVAEERGANPDLVITQSPVTFELIRQGKIDPMAAMGSGDLQVQGMENLPTFQALFAPPELDADIEPMGGAAIG